MYGYFGNVVFGVLVTTAAVLVVVIWVIDVWELLKDRLDRRRHTHEAQTWTRFDDHVMMQERLVDNLRDLEQIANAQYDSATGTREDALLVSAARAKAKIGVIREKVARRLSVISGDR